MNTIEKISKAFNTAAATYEKTAVLQQEVGSRLRERLHLFKQQPESILDLGCGTGLVLTSLRQQFPKAHIVGLDRSIGMLEMVQKKHRWWSKQPLVQADMERLPFADKSFQLIFANQVVHWTSDWTLLWKELYRVLAPEGCVLFSTLGPDTFRELRQAWSTIDHYAHTNTFLDMHDIGDHLVRAGFSDPVMDMEYVSLRYPSVLALLKSLKSQGVSLTHPERRPGLMGKSVLQQLAEAYPVIEVGKYPLCYEVIYGHAWKRAPVAAPTVQETFISIDQIGR
ncbi:MAG: malonyl-ACP O-methyltransferase BioC [Legionellaceae bacterium]|nr:malonyl-ACP O-methyltransferase BioC [Legionellaceae bacterium]